MPFLLKILIILLAIALFLFLLVLYIIAPGKKRDYSKFRGRKYAHRGLHGDGVPENSLAAFKAAREANLGVEFDVQFTKDKQVVVLHYGDLNDMCGVDKKVLDLTYEELKQYRLEGTEERIPLLSEVLKTLGGAPVICEIKLFSGNNCSELCRETCKIMDTYPGDWCIQSFSPFHVQWFRKNRPEIIRGQLSAAMREYNGQNAVNRFGMRHLLINFFSRPDFIAYGFNDLSPWGFRLCRAFYEPFFMAWTVRGEKQFFQAQKDFDTIIFEKNEIKNWNELRNTGG